MRYKLKKDRVDDLVKHFWKFGYLTVSRKYGTYLPEPKPVGQYGIDAIGKFKRQFVIGITLSKDDLNDPSISSKLNYLANRKSKYSHSKIKLFVGVPAELFNTAKSIISSLDEDSKKNIKLLAI